MPWWLKVFSAATRASVIPGPNPDQEGSVVLPSFARDPLFLPGTDDEEDLVQGNLVEEERVDGGVAGADDEDGDLRGQDNNDAPSSDEAPSPFPTKTAHRLRQEPKILFVFDEVTGDFVESHPTIFLPRPAINPAQGTKSDATKKKKKKDSKSKVKAPEVAVPRKRTRDDDEGSQAVDNPVAKKLKSKNIKTADDKGV